MDKDFNERRFKERMRRAERFNDRFWPVVMTVLAMMFVTVFCALVYSLFDPEAVFGALTRAVEGRNG